MSSHRNASAADGRTNAAMREWPLAAFEALVVFLKAVEREGPDALRMNQVALLPEGISRDEISPESYCTPPKSPHLYPPPPK